MDWITETIGGALLCWARGYNRKRLHPCIPALLTKRQGKEFKQSPNMTCDLRRLCHKGLEKVILANLEILQITNPGFGLGAGWR